MTDEHSGERRRFSRKLLTLPSDRLKPKERTPIREQGFQSQSTPTAGRAGANVEYQSVKGILHERLIDEMNEQNVLARPDDELAQFVADFVATVLENEDWPLNEHERRRLGEDLVDETLGVGPLAVLMADPAVTDILVNRFDDIYIERFGQLEETDVRFRDEDHLVRIIQRIASRVGRRVYVVSHGRRTSPRWQSGERDPASRHYRRADALNQAFRPATIEE